MAVLLLSERVSNIERVSIFLALWKIGISLVAAQREFKVLSAQACHTRRPGQDEFSRAPD